MKKFIILAMAAAFAVCAGFAAACSDNGADRPLHIWSEEWSHDSKSHWHACTDEGCPGKDANEYHSFELVSTIKKASCSEEGLGTWQCGVCGYSKEDVIEKTPHTFRLVTVIQSPNCYQPGKGRFICSECDYSEDQMIEATGNHVFTDNNYEHNETSHWRVCSATYGCTATDEPQPHIEGEAVITEPGLPQTEEVDEWVDGAKSYPCKVCGAYMREEPIYHPKAPASYDLYLSNGGVRAEMTPLEKESGFDCFAVTLYRGVEYSLEIENALNNYGKPITIEEGDIGWDVPTLHGMKAYYVNDRGGEEECSRYDGRGAANFLTKLTVNKLAPQDNTLKLIFRFETGINDFNYRNRKIRVTKIFYVTCIEKPAAASLSERTVSAAPAVFGKITAAYGCETEKRRAF